MCGKNTEKESLTAIGKQKNEIDKDILPLLELINSMDEYVTLSSCSGRIAVMDMPDFGNKLESVFIGKWHHPISFKEVLDAAKKGSRTTWLIMFPPIIHIACRDLEAAEKLMRTANEAGFRRCGIISLRNNVVEIASLERVEVPIATHGNLVLDDNALRTIVDIANKKLERSKNKLKRLEKALKGLIEV
ncbi:MAG TPA: hypothetical protein EYP35_04660 [Desulfobacterales bacterium]|nr:hypothetical protein [Desulfobacterales bacterium]